jgi:hypothetical protein
MEVRLGDRKQVERRLEVTPRTRRTYTPDGGEVMTISTPTMQVKIVASLHFTDSKIERWI